MTAHTGSKLIYTKGQPIQGLSLVLIRSWGVPGRKRRRKTRRRNKERR